ncbi:hypothetical protein AAFP30_07550 [Gordonia sp. CPCC 205515]
MKLAVAFDQQASDAEVHMTDVGYRRLNFDMKAAGAQSNPHDRFGS